MSSGRRGAAELTLLVLPLPTRTCALLLAGKSNILDAICFVLGITNMTSVRICPLIATLEPAATRCELASSS